MKIRNAELYDEFRFFILIIIFQSRGIPPNRRQLKNPEQVFGRVREGAFDAKASSRNFLFLPVQPGVDDAGAVDIEDGEAAV